MINKEAEEIRHYFIRTYKHPYINESFYNQVLTTEQIAYFQDILFESGQNQIDELFYALMHMQLSLDIHDLVDLEFGSDYVYDRNQTNQLQVLVGDFHSSNFYRLLSKHNLLDELYHFIQSIKAINELKMSLLHDDGSNIHTHLERVESIHCGLFNSLIDFYKMDYYREKNNYNLLNSLVYSGKSYWLDLLISREPTVKPLVEKRTNNLNKIRYTGER